MNAPNQRILLKGGKIINEGKITVFDILINEDIIEKIGSNLESNNALEINVEGLYIMPGIIDDQVHFREPGLTQKADIMSESRAALVGGVTSFMEMPNTIPNAVSQDVLEDKYLIAKENAYTNYSFFMGATNSNLDEVLKTNPQNVCGIKIFMGASTGNMLVDDDKALEGIFANVPMLIATHCEDETTIKNNLKKYKSEFKKTLTANQHPLIRNIEACLLSSQKAMALAKKHDARLHILHISTEEELNLFNNDKPLKEKRVTSEVCVHHLFFDADDYDALDNKIKCNPAIKAPRHKKALMKALLDDRLDIIATDHAPHTITEKSKPYLEAPSGLPLVQTALQMMLGFYKDGIISLEKIVEKMCHAPAVCFNLADRGFIREGLKADLCIFDPNAKSVLEKEDILYKCGWSPLEGYALNGKVLYTIVNGQLVYANGIIYEPGHGQRLLFNLK